MVEGLQSRKILCLLVSPSVIILTTTGSDLSAFAMVLKEKCSSAINVLYFGKVLQNRFSLTHVLVSAAHFAQGHKNYVMCI